MNAEAPPVEAEIAIEQPPVEADIANEQPPVEAEIAKKNSEIAEAPNVEQPAAGELASDAIDESESESEAPNHNPNDNDPNENPYCFISCPTGKVHFNTIVSEWKEQLQITQPPYHPYGVFATYCNQNGIAGHLCATWRDSMILREYFPMPIRNKLCLRCFNLRDGEETLDKIIPESDWDSDIPYPTLY
jgi:hypothetical protein